jgi:hypothetical protein
MQSALNAFANNLERVRYLHALHASFSGRVTAVVGLSDLLRAEVVLAVSALDHYIHELTRVGMLECLACVHQQMLSINSRCLRARLLR